MPIASGHHGCSCLRTKISQDNSCPEKPQKVYLSRVCNAIRCKSSGSQGTDTLHLADQVRTVHHERQIFPQHDEFRLSPGGPTMSLRDVKSSILPL